MKVRILETGEVTHAPNQMAALMIKSRLWEEVVDPPAPVEVQWFVFKEQFGNTQGLISHSLGFKCGACKSTSYFIPDVNLGAKKIVEVVRPHCIHRTPCPLETANDYVVTGGGTPMTKYELDCVEVNRKQAEELSRPRTF
jgi:hypothetical protein